ncbi:MAG TPA: tRNA (N(6)-L-threonylcarbamoyladenosine(37)-C(2))-methylthiotransferase MtaB [Erysipelotrichaceae bacterium]|nr:tRNA (N(6)-L-threonylcarbamoyladenosine(37)-C(2))-methylthiotransferase MtaB [Erysipelotrichaceae bacterium]
MKTFLIHTLGCKVNAYESEFYRQQLLDAGYQEGLPKEKTDVVIINTCTVTNTASFKSRQKIAQAKRTNPEAFVVVVGCYVQTHHAFLKDKYDIDLLIGAKDKDRLVEMLETKRDQVDYAYPRTFENLPIQSFKHQKKAYVKIQDGCNQFCTYCIIPFARGRERSMDMNKIIEQIKALDQHQEITLTGIHTGRYGLDIGSNLVQLLKRILAETWIPRIRISSIEITEVSDEMIELLRNEPRLAKHLHIPIQAASDEVLRDMNRPYTLNDYKQRLQLIREQVANILISTDLIVGFPSESKEDFEESLLALEMLNFSFMHVFPYSKREGTKASLYKEEWTNEIKKERVHQAQSLSDKMHRKTMDTFLNHEIEVLLEETQDDMCFGYSGEYLPVLVKDSQDLLNQRVLCRVIGVKNDHLIAERVIL